MYLTFHDHATDILTVVQVDQASFLQIQVLNRYRFEPIANGQTSHERLDRYVLKDVFDLLTECFARHSRLLGLFVGHFLVVRFGSMSDVVGVSPPKMSEGFALLSFKLSFKIVILQD